MKCTCSKCTIEKVLTYVCTGETGATVRGVTLAEAVGFLKLCGNPPSCSSWDNHRLTFCPLQICLLFLEFYVHEIIQYSIVNYFETHLLCCNSQFFFFLLTSMTLYEYAMFCLFTDLLMSFWTVSSFWFLQIKLLWTLLYKAFVWTYACICFIELPRSIMAGSYEEIANLVSRVIVLFCFSLVVFQSSGFFISYPALGMATLLILDVLKGI